MTTTLRYYWFPLQATVVDGIFSFTYGLIHPPLIIFVEYGHSECIVHKVMTNYIYYVLQLFQLSPAVHLDQTEGMMWTDL